MKIRILENVKIGPSLQELIQKIESSPFFQFLEENFRRCFLSKEEFAYRAQEDNFWRHRFLEQEVLRIKKRALNSEGRQTGEFLTLEMIQDETKKEIESKK